MVARRLTQTEERVVRLIAAGFDGEEVAGALHVSRRTIDWHIARACWKLGARSRAELPALLADTVRREEEIRATP
jgi:DNA-binding CsgD family transcriptional regulator